MNNFTVQTHSGNFEATTTQNVVQLKLITANGQELLIMVDNNQIKIDVLSDYQAIFSVMGNRVTIT